MKLAVFLLFVPAGYVAYRLVSHKNQPIRAAVPHGLMEKAAHEERLFWSTPTRVSPAVPFMRTVLGGSAAPDNSSNGIEASSPARIRDPSQNLVAGHRRPVPPNRQGLRRTFRTRG